MNTLTNSWAGYLSLFLFVIAYMLVIAEDKLHLKKSKPVLLAGCLMWVIIAIYESANGGGHVEERVKHMLGEIAAIFFFILVAMTYINTLQERLVFAALRTWLVKKGFGFRSLFWITGITTFFLSAVADNLTSALLMATVVNAVGGSNRRFIIPAFINIIVAANAGGAWSPFGDITTLMVWTSGKAEASKFLTLFLPSLVNWIIPAVIMFFSIPSESPVAEVDVVKMKKGAKRIIFLGFLTIFITLLFHHILHLPPFLGMMTGLGLLMFMGFLLQRHDKSYNVTSEEEFNIFRKVEKVEFDTLFFFFGIITAVGALQYIGYLSQINVLLYQGLGNTYANTIIGLISAVIDNVPVVYAVLQMNPAMDTNQWLLHTLAAGTGGSLLSIGSAAGVAVMGVRRDIYTFSAHLKWLPAIALGYFSSIGCWWLIMS